MSTGESSQGLHQQLTSTSGFLCDLCGEPIFRPCEAWGQWYTQRPSTPNGKVRNWNFSIVHGEAHSPTCTIQQTVHQSIGDVSLDFLLSADGLTYLLEFFVERDVEQEDLCRFLLRLFVPGYEQAHRYIGAALAECLYEQRSHRAFLTQREIGFIAEGRRDGRFNL